MPLPDLSPALEDAYKKADRQYQNKYNETCQVCGRKNLHPTIEWAKKENQQRKFKGETPIIVKNCYYCRQLKKRTDSPNHP